MRALRSGTSWAGLLAGPSAWAVSTQFNYAVVEWQCRSQLPVIPFAAVVLIGLALAGGALSLRAWRRGGASFKPERTLDTERFISLLGILASVLFSAVILMQGTASLILDWCTR